MWRNALYEQEHETNGCRNENYAGGQNDKRAGGPPHARTFYNLLAAFNGALDMI